MSSTVSHLNDLLGPAEDRYFGSGYRRSLYTFWDIKAEVIGGILRGRCEASVNTWTRTGAPRASHLTTPDAMTLAVRLGNSLINLLNGWDTRRTHKVQEVSVRAGSKSFDGGNVIPCEATARPSVTALTRLQQTFDVKVGSLRCAVTFVLDVTAQDSRSSNASWSLPTLPAVPGYWGDGPSRPAFHFLDVAYDPTALACSAVIHQQSPRGTANNIDILDCLVIASQLAQVALLSEASTTREQVGNLWMRRCEFHTIVHEDSTEETYAETRIDKVQRVDLNGSPWLIADVSIAPLFGVVGTASLALPLSTE